MTLSALPVRLLTCFSLLAVGLAAPAVHADEAEPPQRTISLTATGEVDSAPDLVEISTGVVSDAKSAADALEKNSKAMTKMIAALKAEGIAPKDIQTSNFSIRPRYDRPEKNKPQVLVGYRVNNSLHLKVRDVKALGAILDKLVSLGANNIGNIAFGLADPAATEDEARKLAMKEAIARAELYAEAAGVKLGKVISINEQGGVRPYKAVARMEAASAAPVPIEAGTTTTSITVNVTWELE
ncbi:SIMPL domain-containing protein [Methyloligella sp. 2.7D]|uniref:SIMPL domain-containing protein n=1 Tax=unclassified Methyloligella TaxID=2625955 RepID=UPI00157C017B|nr:SIMPL domain-containing protein [Methyloligella sp. GL2]QKP78032.1 SIMPL domain-containing protein [Methyloligella sp. GL2]